MNTELNWYKIRGRLLIIMIMFALGAGTSRFIILSNIGAQGSAVTRVRIEKESIRLQNETLRAQIDGIRTLEQVQKGIDQVFGSGATRTLPRQITTSSIDSSSLLSLKSE